MDEQQKVRTITALAIAALAESATPYGIESFDSVLKPLWKGTLYIYMFFLLLCNSENLPAKSIVLLKLKTPGRMIQVNFTNIPSFITFDRCFLL